MLDRDSDRGPVASVVVVVAAALLVSGCAGDVHERIESIHELKLDPSPENLEKIRRYLDDPDKDVRSTAMFALVTAGVPDAIDLALDGLEDPDAFVRMTAAVLLGDFEDPAVASPLAERLLHDEDWMVRWRAAESLGTIGGEVAVDALAEGMSDPLQKVRLASVIGISRHAPAVHVEMLSRLVRDDPEWEVRVQAARALGRSRDPAAGPALEAALDDSNEFVRSAAAYALSLLDESG